MKLPKFFGKNDQHELPQKLGEKFLLGIAYGLGQALGLTLIFAMVVKYFSTLITTLGGIPFLGNLIAKIVEATQNSMGQF